MEKEISHSEEQAAAQLQSIWEMVEALESATDDEAREEAEQTIHEDPLSVEVRTDWHTLDAEDQKPTHYRILLCTGGPAVQLVGDLTEHLEPENARIEHQDWGAPWTEYRPTTEKQREAMLKYAQQFYFGE